MASYSIATFLAMMIYWALLLDLAIFSMRISAYVPRSSLGELCLESPSAPALYGKPAGDASDT